MGILDASLATIRRGAVAEMETAPSAPMRILPSSPGGSPSEFSQPQQERINVPPGAFPQNPIPGNSYFQGARFTQNVRNSHYNNSPGPQPPQPKDPTPDPKLNNLIKADILSNALNFARSAADSWFPHIAWEGTVQATGYKTTPLRTVIHYALAVAFGLIKQQRISSCSLVVNADYETNHVTVAYISKAYWLTEILTMGMYSYSLAADAGKQLADNDPQTNKQLRDVFSRSLLSGFAFGAVGGVIELGKQALPLAGDALKLIIKSYQNMGRLLGPLAVYDMGDETLYGGRASILLRSPEQPEPFKSMQSDGDGKPVPLLTRLPAGNPQPAVAIGTDPSSGYSLDLRSLVAQALYDPGILPPVPDTNVSLTPVY